MFSKNNGDNTMPILLKPNSLRMAFLILLFSLLIIFQVKSQFPDNLPPNFIFKKWDSNTGLPEKTVNDILQTKNGYLWIATYEGIARFDGTHFNIYDKNNLNGLTTNIIYNLNEDYDENLWLGTNGGGVLKLKNGKVEVFSTSNNKLLHDVARSIITDKRGRTWIGTDGGLHSYENNTVTKYTTKDGLSQNLVNWLFEDAEENLWISLLGKGIDIFNDGKKINNFNISDGLPSNSVFAFCQDQNGNIWIGTQSGLSFYKNNKFHNIKFEGLHKTLIRSLHFDTLRNVVWAGTGQGRIFRIQSEKDIIEINHDFGSIGNVNALTSDNEGNLWIGLFKGGLYRKTKANFNLLTKNDGLVNNVINVVGTGKSKNLYIGTTNAGLNILKNGEIKLLSAKTGLTKNNINSILEDSKGNLWVGTYRAWLNKITPTGIIHYKEKDGLQNNFISSLFEDSSGTIWVGTYGSGLFYFKKGKFFKYPIPDEKGLDNEIIRIIFESNNRTLWIGSNTGLTSIKNNVIKKYNRKNGLSYNTVVSAFQDKNDDGIWFGTRGGGLNYFKNGKFISCSVKNGLFNDVVYWILDDDLGRFWMSCNKGIFSIEKKQLYDFISRKITKVTCEVYGIADGMKTVECSGGFGPAACKTSNGVLCFPTLNGLVLIEPKKLFKSNIPPKVDIQMIKADSNVFYINNQSNYSFTGTANKLEIDYTALSFTVPEKTVFKTKLEGFDQKWSNVGSRRTAYYTNLHYGSYIFKVKASNGGDIWSDKTASIKITIPTPYWRSFTFQFASILSLLILVYTIYYIRIRTIKNQKLRLEKIISRRTAEITQQKESLVELNKEKDSLIGIVAHDLKSPLNQIKGFTSLLKMENPQLPKNTLDYIDQITYTTERLNAMIRKILDINAIESENVKLDIKGHNICELVTEIVDRYRNNAKNKKINLYFYCETEDLFAFIDKNLFSQSIENLIANAIKFSPPFVGVEVKITRVDKKLRVIVKDEGPGITKEDMPKLFGKFQKLSAQPTGGEDSTGLGLSIVKKYINALKGEVWCESEEGKGASFIIEIE